MNRYNKVIYEKSNNSYDKKFIEYIIKNYFNKPGSILDIGCGNGKHLDIFNMYGFYTYGIDIRKQKQEYIKTCNIETDKIPFDNNRFDYIFSKSLFEHILRADNAIEECYRVLKPNGKIIIIVPEWLSQMKHYWDDYTHLHPWTYKSLKDLLMIYNFRDVKCEIFYQLPFVWKHPNLRFIPKLVSILPQQFKWKNKEMRNGDDRKLIRFSKERMLLGYGIK